MNKGTIIAFVLLAIGVLVLFGATFGGNTDTYEDFVFAEANPNKSFHIAGELQKQKKMEYDPLKDPNYFSFFMQDKKGEVRKVVYFDSKPQEIDQSETIVAIGKMVDDEFHASKILQKCPSKYVDEEIELKNYQKENS